MYCCGEKIDVAFFLNGKPFTLHAEPHTTLLRALRHAGVTSVKRGCEEGECGTCTVLVDDLPQKSCMILTYEVKGKNVLTAEGLIGPNGEIHPIQQAYVDEGAIQCGYCTPGMILVTFALLKNDPDPSEETIKEYFSGNLCRCTGYTGIIRAVKESARRLGQARR